MPPVQRPLIGQQTFAFESTADSNFYGDGLSGLTSRTLENGVNGGSADVDSTIASANAGMMGYDSTWVSIDGVSDSPLTNGEMLLGVTTGVTNRLGASETNGVLTVTFDELYVAPYDNVDFLIQIDTNGGQLTDAHALDRIVITVKTNVGDVEVMRADTPEEIAYITGTDITYFDNNLGQNVTYFASAQFADRDYTARLPDGARTAQLEVEIVSIQSPRAPEFYIQHLNFEGDLGPTVLNSTQAVRYSSLTDAVAAANAGDVIDVDAVRYPGGDAAIVNRNDDLQLFLDDYGAPGYTTIIVATGANIFTHSGSADMHIRAANGDKTVTVGSGDDLVKGFRGDNIFDLGAGNDRAYAGEDNDQINGGDGDDVLFGQNGNDTLLGGGAYDRLFGGDGADNINGGAGNDDVIGEAGGDILDGGAGHDRIYLGATDALGDGAADIVKFDAAVDGQDRVWGFEDGIDKLQLSGFANGMTDLRFTDAPDGRVLISKMADPQPVGPPGPDWLISVFGVTSAEISNDIIFV